MPRGRAAAYEVGPKFDPPEELASYPEPAAEGRGQK